MKSIIQNASVFCCFACFTTILMSSSLISCKENTSTNTENTTQFSQDSTELTELVRQTYTWVETTDPAVGGFEPIQKNPTDTIYSEIDLQKQKENTEILEKSSFFSKEFLENYQNLANQMNEKLKNGNAVWLVGDLPPFVGSGVNAWCNCQDYPEKYWEKLLLSNFEKQGEETAFMWTLDNGFKYNIRAKKENDVWKISYLEGFDEKNYEVEVIE